MNSNNTKTTRKDRLRREIMIAIRANGLIVTGEVWFTLIFRTEQELAKIARGLHISVE